MQGGDGHRTTSLSTAAAVNDARLEQRMFMALCELLARVNCQAGIPQAEVVLPSSDTQSDRVNIYPTVRLVPSR